ncbi:MAG: hypothetical protein MZW92_70900 [Comamonadaceae bacterium]|nr:hypothetical protein [Comamonadaceae bacterium]
MVMPWGAPGGKGHAVSLRGWLAPFGAFASKPREQRDPDRRALVFAGGPYRHRCGCLRCRCALYTARAGVARRDGHRGRRRPWQPMTPTRIP